MIPFDQEVLLDTNILLHYARKNEVSRRIESEYTLAKRDGKLSISIVNYAESLVFASYNQWGQEKIERLDYIVNQLHVFDRFDVKIVQYYKDLAMLSRQQGYAIGQNDLWIAATAGSLELALLTTDKDFQWIPQELVKVYVADTVFG